MNAFDIALSEQMARFLEGEMTLREFRRWFLPLAWAEAEDGYLRSPLARRVELRLAEYANGHWSAEDLRSLFMRELPTTAGLSVRLVMALQGAVSSEPAELPVAPRPLLLTAS